MNIPFKIARRYFFSRKGGGAFNLISILSGISLLGYIVGAAALLIVLSVFNGFEGLFKGMYNHFDADMQITIKEGKTFNGHSIDSLKLYAIEGVEKVSYVLEENVLLKYGERQNLAIVKGVDEAFISLTGLDSSMVAGVLLLQDGDTDFTVAGQGIAYQLSIDPNNPFELVHVFVPNKEEVDVLNPSSAFSEQTLLPVGVFSVQEEVDTKYIITSLRFLHQLLNRPEEYSSIELKLKNTANPDKVKAELEALCGESFVVKDRFEQREAFYKVMRSEKLISYFILFFILLIAAGNTIGSLYILVIEKKKDIQLLSALGFTGVKTRNIFLWQGLLMAFVGSLFGLAIGIAVVVLQAEYGFVKLDGAASFMFSAYPVELRWGDVVIVFATVLFLGLLTAIYPASKARRITG
jgi:lipoprotein-releasing system permease protein